METWREDVTWCHILSEGSPFHDSPSGNGRFVLFESKRVLFQFRINGSNRTRCGHDDVGKLALFEFMYILICCLLLQLTQLTNVQMLTAMAAARVNLVPAPATMVLLEPTAKVSKGNKNQIYAFCFFLQNGFCLCFLHSMSVQLKRIPFPE